MFSSFLHIKTIVMTSLISFYMVLNVKIISEKRVLPEIRIVENQNKRAFHGDESPLYQKITH